MNPSRVARNSLAVLVARGADLAAGVITIPLLTRYLGPDGYGDYAWVLALVYPFQVLVNFELNTILTREIARSDARSGDRPFAAEDSGCRPEVAEDRDRAPRQVGAALWIKWTLIVVFAAGMAGLTLLLDLPPKLAAALALAVAGEVAAQHALLWSGVFHAYQRMEIETGLALVYRFVSLAGLVAVVALDLGFVAVFVPLALAALLRAGLGTWMLRRSFVRPELRPNWPAVRELVREAGVMTFASTLMALAMRVSIYLLERLGGAEAVSLFNLPFMLLLSFQMLPVALVTALYPLLSRWREENPQLLARTADLAGAALVLAGGALAVLATPIAGPIVVLLSGPAYADAARSLRVLLLAAPILFLNYLATFLLIALGRQRLLATGALATIVINTGAGAVLIARYGHPGAAWALLAGLLAQQIIVMVYLKKHLAGLSLARSVVRPTLAITAGYAAARAGMLVHPAAGLAAGAAALALGTTFGRLFTREELELLRRSLSRRGRGRQS